MTGTPINKQVVCLAASWRPGGHCFACKEFNGNDVGPWIRPVNLQNNNAISQTDCRYANGHAANVLDVFTVTLDSPAPKGHQKENYAIAIGSAWTKQAVATWDVVKRATDSRN